MRTPQYKSITIGAGANLSVNMRGKYVTILSISASTILLAMDDDTPQQVVSGLQIPSASPFGSLRWSNTGGASSTIVFYVSDTQIIDFRQSALSAAIAANIALIADDLSPPDTPTAFAAAVIAQTGVGTTAIIAAAAGNRKVLIQADQDNAGSVYLGWTNAVTAATCFARLAPGESWHEECACGVWACSQNGTEEVRGYAIAIA